MTSFLMRRVATGLVQIAILLTAVFFLIRTLPADPVARFVGMNATADAYAQVQQNLGLDKSSLEQFAIYLFGEDDRAGLIQGSLAQSWVSGSMVADHIGRTLPVTMELIILAFLVAVGVGVPIGMLGAVKPGGKADKGVLIYGLFAGSQPEFSWGSIFIFIFFVWLGIAPGPVGRLSPLTDPPTLVTGMLLIDSLIAGRADLFFEALWYLALPVFTLAFVLSGPIIKMVRENVSRALEADYIHYAAAVGLPPKMRVRDALRAAFAPTLTLIGVLFGFMIGGAVLVENIFSINGLGQFTIQSILAMDYPAIQGVVIVISALTLLIYLLVDVGQALLDPRVRL